MLYFSSFEPFVNILSTNILSKRLGGNVHAETCRNQLFDIIFVPYVGQTYPYTNDFYATCLGPTNTSQSSDVANPGAAHS